MNAKTLVGILVVAVAALVGVVLFLGREDAPDAPATGSETPADEAVPDAPVAVARRAAAPGPRTKWVLAGTGTVVGIVRAYGSDLPMGDVEVVLEAGEPGPSDTLRTRTRADGGFLFPSVANFDAWTLRVKAPAPLGDTEMGGVTVIETRETDVGTVYLVPAFAVPGVVVDDKGTPIPDAVVRAVKSRPASSAMDILRLIRELPARSPAVDQTVTGADGAFALRKVPPGQFDITVEKPGYQVRVEAGVVITPDAQQRPMKLVLLRGFTVDGRVVREGDGPVAGLPIVAFRQPNNPTDFNALDKVFAATDEQGRFRLEGLPGGRFVVAVTPENEPSVADVDVSVPTTGVLEIRMKGDAWLEGRVTGEGDLPVQNAQVYALRFEGTPTVANVRTDADGRYVIRGLASGRLQLFLVKAEGFGDYPDDIASLFTRGDSDDAVTLEPGRNEKNVSLAKGAIVRGLVREKGDAGAPVAGARVELASPAAMLGGNRTATSGPDGRFEITSVPRGTSVLLVSKDGWFQPGVNPQSVAMVLMGQMGNRPQTQTQKDTGRGATVVVSEPGEVLERTVELSRGSSVAGTVLAPDGRPQAGARVSLVLDSAGDDMSRMLGGLFPTPDPKLSDAEGRFEMPGPPPGQKARVVARAAGFLDGRSDPLTCSPGDALTGVAVSLRVGATLAGRVRDDGGRPVVGAMVRWVKPEADENEWALRWRLGSANPATTDAKGEFSVTNVETGRLFVQVTSPRYLAWSKADVDAEDGRATQFDVSLVSGRSITGRVLDVNGRPKAGAVVNWSRGGEAAGDEDPTQARNGNTSTDDAGAFTIEGLAAGEYELTAHAAGAAPSSAVTTAAGGQAVTLQLAQAFAVTGVVRMKGGAPVAGVEVVLVAVRAATGPNGDSEERTEIATVRSGADGSFELKEIPAGSYDVSARAGWGGAERPNVVPATVKGVEAGRQGVIVEMEPGLSIRGTVTGTDGQPLASGWAWAQPENPAEGGQGVGAQVEGGSFEIVGLARGKHRITVSSQQGARRTVTAEAGAADLAINMAGGGKIRVRVVNPDGTPAAVATVAAYADGAGGQAVTGEDGVAEIDGLAEGSYSVHVRSGQGASRVSGSLEAVAVTAGRTAEVEVRMAKRE